MAQIKSIRGLSGINAIAECEINLTSGFPYIPFTSNFERTDGRTDRQPSLPWVCCATFKSVLTFDMLWDFSFQKIVRLFSYNTSVSFDPWPLCGCLITWLYQTSAYTFSFSIDDNIFVSSRKKMHQLISKSLIFMINADNYLSRLNKLVYFTKKVLTHKYAWKQTLKLQTIRT